MTGYSLDDRPQDGRWILRGDPAGPAGGCWLGIGGLEVAFDADGTGRVVMVRSISDRQRPWLESAPILEALLGTDAIEELRKSSTIPTTLADSTDTAGTRRRCAQLALIEETRADVAPTPLWDIDQLLVVTQLAQDVPALGFASRASIEADLASSTLRLLIKGLPDVDPTVQGDLRNMLIGEAVIATLRWLEPDHPERAFLEGCQQRFRRHSVDEFLERIAEVAGRGAGAHEALRDLTLVAGLEGAEAAEIGDSTAVYEQRLDISDAPTGLLDGDDSLTVNRSENALTITVPLGSGLRGTGVSASEAARAWVRVVDEWGRVLATANLMNLDPTRTTARATLQVGDEFDPRTCWIEIVADPRRIGTPRVQHLLAIGHRSARLALAEERLTRGLGLEVSADERWEDAAAHFELAGLPDVAQRARDRASTPPGTPTVFLTELAHRAGIRVTYGDLETELERVAQNAGDHLE